MWFSSASFGEACAFPATNTIRIAAAQPQRRSIDWHIRNPKELLAHVDQSLRELAGLIDQAAAQRCDVIVFPEDTRGLSLWEADNHTLAGEVLPEAFNTC